MGIGAVLSQLDENGDDYPVAYYSKKLLPREQNYATVEQECLAIKLSIECLPPRKTIHYPHGPPSTSVAELLSGEKWAPYQMEPSSAAI